MNASAPDRLPQAPLPPVRGAPILIVAGLPGDVLAWGDALRRRHYPPERNRLPAHVTLFHGLPPSAEGEVHRLLARVAAATPPPEGRISGLMDLGQGTAIAVDSPALCAIHRDLADSLSGLVQQKDDRPLRPHITIQNKVARDQAQALQAELSGQIPPRSFRFPALSTHRWDGESWAFERSWAFRG